VVIRFPVHHHCDNEERNRGPEFDRAIVVEPAAIVAAEPDQRTGLRRLYVVLTRAVSELTVVHTRPLPGALSRPSTAPPTSG
jgi:hypothetical protein